MKDIQWVIDLFKRGIQKAHPSNVIKENVRLQNDTLMVKNDPFPCKNLWVVGAGKASAEMGKALEELLGEKIKGGIIVTKDGHGVPLSFIEVREASHPIPDERGLKASEDILKFVEKLGEEDTLIVLISGGGSALLPLPQEGLSLEEKQEITRIIMESGANIEELNTVRKHLSRIKGGRLTQSAFPATVITLAISDVIGDYSHLIASGPTVPDPSTYKDAKDILLRRGIWEDIPPRSKEIIEKGLKGLLPETPKGGEAFWKRNYYYILASNEIVLESIKDLAEKEGVKTVILSSSIRGEAKEVAKVYVAIAEEIRRFSRPFDTPLLILGGGETTVTVKGKGKGGRNQEMALAFSIEAGKIKDFYFLCAGTDGTDGPTDAAGAWVDENTYTDALKKGLTPENFLKENDSYHFFKKMDSLLITGPTGTNVMDIHMLLLL
ncbi:glycerate kinase [Candidatus Calescamantes bacterium]|nr:glycerate kinase [Candidatus Calescamantes bacterium]